MTKKVFDFQERLKFGDAAERKFAEGYHSELEFIKERYADFRRVSDGAIVELKSDSYSHEKTENFFIERFSSEEKQSPGSFWQSVPKGVQVFCYFFPSDGIYYEFTDLPKVLEKLDDILREGKLKPVRIFNEGWTGVGYKVPRSWLQDYWTKYELGVKK